MGVSLEDALAKAPPWSQIKQKATVLEWASKIVPLVQVEPSIFQGASKMRFPKLVLSSLLMFAALSATVEAQECVNGQCSGRQFDQGWPSWSSDLWKSILGTVSSFRVGGYDSDGMLITSIGSPTPAPAIPEATASAQSFSDTPPVIESSRRERKTSRQAILEAAKTAHDDCRIDSQQLMLIRVATLSPRLMKAVEEQLARKLSRLATRFRLTHLARYQLSSTGIHF